MELPTDVVKAQSVNPNSMLVYATPKMGKSTIMAYLTTTFNDNSLIISNEPNGYNFLDARVVEALNAKQFREATTAIKERNKTKKLEFLIVDSITKLDEWSEIIGTLNYMDTGQGKKFNRLNDIPNGVKLKPNSKQFETVHDIGQGYGYKHSRNVMIDWFNELRLLADHVIFVAHVKDKMVSANLGEQVTAITINLTGKVKDIYCANVDAIAMLVTGKDTTERYLSFKAKDESKYMGSRASHLKDKILISSSKEDKIKTYWENIFI